MNLLFTGASGFLGINTIPILEKSFSIKTLGLTHEDDYCINMAHEVPNLDIYFDIVLHAAGKAHTVPRTDIEKQSFFDVNLDGTINLCSALERSGIPKSFIFISSVAVYGLESGENITEEYPLNGKSPYALSKIRAEQFLTNWCREHNVILSIIRPSLIAGPNPPGNLGSMIKGISSGSYFSISGGEAQKSVLMVEDIANLVPLLVQKGGIYNVCDSEQPKFRDLEKTIAYQLNKSLPITIPLFFAKFIALIGDIIGNKSPINSEKLDKITKSLTFSNAKAILELGWNPLNVLVNFRIFEK